MFAATTARFSLVLSPGGPQQRGPLRHPQRHPAPGRRISGSLHHQHADAATGGKHGAFSSHGGPPVTARFRRLDSDKLKEAKAIFAAWERDGVVQRSSSQWSSPLHMVKKKDGSWRPCGDFRCLNLATKADKYPVPSLADFSSQLEGCTVFSTLNLKNSYLQVPLEKSAIPKTAVITSVAEPVHFRLAPGFFWPAPAPALVKKYALKKLKKMNNSTSCSRKNTF